MKAEIGDVIDPTKEKDVLISDDPPSQKTTKFKVDAKAHHYFRAPGAYHNHLRAKRLYHMFVADHRLCNPNFGRMVNRALRCSSE